MGRVRKAKGLTGFSMNLLDVGKGLREILNNATSAETKCIGNEEGFYSTDSAASLTWFLHAPPQEPRFLRIRKPLRPLQDTPFLPYPP